MLSFSTFIKTVFIVSMKKAVFILCVFCLISSCKREIKDRIQSTENDIIEVLNFAEFEPLLRHNDDTIYVINFWATWCAPCVKELPNFQEIHDTYSTKNVKVILVSLDFPDKLKSTLIPFVKNRNLSPQVILLDDPDENSWIPKIDESWSGAIPATLIYNKNKRAFYEQSFTKENLFKEIEKFTKN